MNMERFTSLCQLNGSRLERIFYKKEESVLDLCIRAGAEFNPARITEGTLLTLHFTEVTNCSFERRKYHSDTIIYAEAFSPGQIYLEASSPDGSLSTMYIHAGDVEVIPVLSAKLPCTAAIA